MSEKVFPCWLGGLEEMNHFQRLNEVKELKIFFSRNAQIHRSRHRAGDQSRTAQARGARIRHVRAAHSRHVSAARRRPAAI